MAERDRRDPRRLHDTDCRARSYLDMAFVHPDHLRQGVASALYSVIEGRARALGLVRLDTEASLLAEPLFAARGWRVTRRQKVVRRGVTLKQCLDGEAPDAPGRDVRAAFSLKENGPKSFEDFGRPRDRLAGMTEDHTTWRCACGAFEARVAPCQGHAVHLLLPGLPGLSGASGTVRSGGCSGRNRSVSDPSRPGDHRERR